MSMNGRIELTVPFFDVDAMRIAWHGHFAKYFELARCRLLEEIGHGYDAMFASGYAWPIVDMRIRYLRPLRFNQCVEVTAALKRWDYQLKIAYRIRDLKTSTALVRGTTLQAPVNIETGELYLGQPPAVARVLSEAGLSPPENREFP